jgi:hypothetical protein
VNTFKLNVGRQGFENTKTDLTKDIQFQLIKLIEYDSVYLSIQAEIAQIALLQPGVFPVSPCTLVGHRFFVNEKSHHKPQTSNNGTI